MDQLNIRAIVAASVCLPGAAMALGLGNIEVNSRLNQRLDAEIEIVGATPADLQRLSATLASREAFAAQGIDYYPAFSSIDIEARRNQRGQVVLHLTSSKSIVEPIATLVIAADWTRGRMQRTYSILLDPPGLNDSSSAPLTASAAAAPAPTPTAPRVSRPAPVAPVPRTVTPSAQRPKIELGAQYGPVQAGESLWKIAVRVRPEGADLESTMAAIYDANPGAFAGSMDRLKQGVLLDVPAAAAFVGGPAPQATSATSLPAPGVAPGAPASGSGAATPEAAEATADPAMTSLLAAVRRQIDSTRAQNAELNEELVRLTDRLTSTSELLTTREAQITRLQAQLAEWEAGTPVAGASAASSATMIAAAPVAEGQATTASAPPREGVLRSMGNALVWFALGGLAMLGLTRLRRRAPTTASGQVDVAQRPLPASTDAAVTPVEAPVARPIEVPASPPSIPTPDIAAVGDVAPLAGGESSDTAEPTALPRAPHLDPQTLVMPPPLADVAGMNELQTVEDDGPVDAVAEADILLAYELHSQAADLVQTALRREPNSVALQAKLLDVYFAAENADEFVAAARVYQSSLREHAGFWRRTVAMGRELCPHEELFGLAAIAPAVRATGEGPGSTASDGAMLDIDLGLDESSTDEFPTVRAKILEPQDVAEDAAATEDDEDMTARLSQPMYDIGSLPAAPEEVPALVEDDSPTEPARTIDRDTAEIAAELAAAVLDDDNLEPLPHTVEEHTLVEDDTALSVATAELEVGEEAVADTQADTVMSSPGVMIGDRPAGEGKDQAPDDVEDEKLVDSNSTTLAITMDLVRRERREEPSNDPLPAEPRPKRAAYD